MLNLFLKNLFGLILKVSIIFVIIVLVISGLGWIFHYHPFYILLLLIAAAFIIGALVKTSIDIDNLNEKKEELEKEQLLDKLNQYRQTHEPNIDDEL